MNLQEELEYLINIFREQQIENFDQNGKKYAATKISEHIAELMLKIINLAEYVLLNQSVIPKDKPLEEITTKLEILAYEYADTLTSDSIQSIIVGENILSAFKWLLNKLPSYYPVPVTEVKQPISDAVEPKDLTTTISF